MSSSIQVSLRQSNLKKIMEAANVFNQKHQVVGVLDSAPAGLAEIAYKNEFGATGASSDLHHDIPERSFIRAAINEWENDIFQDLLADYFWELLVKKGAEYILDKTGEYAEVAIINHIRTDQPNKAPNAPYTLERKQSTVPLVDKGVLESNITHKGVDG